MGHGREVQIEIEGTRVAVRDFGRGIPLGKVVDCVSKINTGAKYNDEVFQFSVGLNGVGTKAVNALSKDVPGAQLPRGEFVGSGVQAGQAEEGEERQGRQGSRRHADRVSSPTRRSSRSSSSCPEHVERRLRHYSYLNTGLKLIYNGKTFQSRNGLLDLVMEDLQADGSEPIYPPLHYASKTLEFCFTHSNSRYGETFYSFVNGQYTARRRHAPERLPRRPAQGGQRICQAKFEGDDVRESMVGAVAIRLQGPGLRVADQEQAGQHRDPDRAGEPGARGAAAVLQPQQGRSPRRSSTKVEDTRQLRKELQEVKKLARERAKAITIRIPQLKDCKVHFDKKRGQGQGHDGLHHARASRPPARSSAAAT